MRFLETDEAEEISKILQEMTQTDPNAATTHAVLVITHPKTGDTALAWPDDFKLRPHPNKDINARADAGLSIARAARLKSKAQAKSGVFEGFAEFFSVSDQRNIRTREEFRAAGWFREF